MTLDSARTRSQKAQASSDPSVLSFLASTDPLPEIRREASTIFAFARTENQGEEKVERREHLPTRRRGGNGALRDAQRDGRLCPQQTSDGQQRFRQLSANANAEGFWRVFDDHVPLYAHGCSLD